MALIHRGLQQAHAQRDVAGHSRNVAPLHINFAKGHQGRGMSLAGRALQKFNSANDIGGHADAVEHQGGQLGLGLGMALVSRQLQQSRGLVHVRRYAIATPVHPGQGVLGSSIALGGQGLQFRPGRDEVAGVKGGKSGFQVGPGHPGRRSQQQEQQG